MRDANAEINSVLRGAEADLKDTDQLLREIDVIWREYDEAARGAKDPRRDARAVTGRAPAEVIIEPASSAGHAPANARPPPAVTVVYMPPRTTTLSQPKTGDQLLGYIREQDTLNHKGDFSDCGVLDEQQQHLRSCLGFSVTRL